MFNPPDPKTFNAAVWLIVRQIPAGQVSSYGQIASMFPPTEEMNPDQLQRLGPRWVGQAMRATPEGQDIPWQRVINSQGQISFPPGSSAAEEQRMLLEIEGVDFDDKGRVDFDLVGWEGPPDQWLEEHNFLPPHSLKKKSKKSDTGDEGSQLALF